VFKDIERDEARVPTLRRIEDVEASHLDAGFVLEPPLQDRKPPDVQLGQREARHARVQPSLRVITQPASEFERIVTEFRQRQVSQPRVVIQRRSQ
jgi:hypothetical protein